MKARTYFVLLAVVLAAPCVSLAKISAEHDNVGYDANYFIAVLECCHCKGACPLGQAIAAIPISPFENHEGRLQQQGNSK